MTVGLVPCQILDSPHSLSVQQIDAQVKSSDPSLSTEGTFIWLLVLIQRDQMDLSDQLSSFAIFE